MDQMKPAEWGEEFLAAASTLQTRGLVDDHDDDHDDGHDNPWINHINLRWSRWVRMARIWLELAETPRQIFSES